MKQPILFETQTRRLILRLISQTDAKELHAAIKESVHALQRWLSWAKTAPSESDVAEFIVSCERGAAQGRYFCFPVFEKYSRSLVGCCELCRTQVHAVFEIGYWARSSCQGKGFITEAAGAIVQLASRYMRADRLEILSNRSNERACRVAERAGFEKKSIHPISDAGVPREAHNVIYVKRITHDDTDSHIYKHCC